MRFALRNNLPLIAAMVLVASSLLFFSVSGHSQSPAGTLQGEVQDAAHGRIASASVTVRSLGTGLERQVKTDSRGEFHVPDLQPGNYRMVVNAAGFAEASSDVTALVSNVRDVLDGDR